jgi:hypothetical protein
MKKFLVVILITQCHCYLYGQSSFSLLLESLKFENVSGGIIEYAPSRFILSTIQRTNQDTKYWEKIFKFNSYGDSLQSLIINKDTSCFFNDMYQISSNNIICVGGHLNKNSPASIWIACIDTSLNLIWEKSIESTALKVQNARMTLFDGSTLVAVFTLKLSNAFDFCQYIVKIDYNGNIIQSSIFGPNHGVIFDILKLGYDSKLLLPAMGFGEINSTGQIIVLDSSLNQVYIDSIPGNVSNCCSVKSLNDSVYFLAGNKSYPFNEESYNIAFMKMNFPNIVSGSHTVGRIADTVDFGGSFKSMDFSDPSNIYVAGTSNLSVSGGYYAYQPSWYLISRFDSALNIYWTKYYGGDAYYVLATVTATSDGGAIVAGSRFDYLNHPENQLDVYVLKVDSTGLYVNVDEEKPIPIHDAIVYPNPGSDYLIVQSGPQVSGAVFRMYDMQGRQVMEERLTSTLLHLSAGNLSAGTYPWQIIFNNKTIENGKWVKDK